jgi:hypothetical protein
MIKLEIEVVPKPLWYINVRTQFPKAWDILRRQTYKAAHYRCEICGGIGVCPHNEIENTSEWITISQPSVCQDCREKINPIEAHEIWEYTITGNTGLQKLIGLICLCPTCHDVKHWGRSGLVYSAERMQELTEHICRINDWKASDLRRYLAQLQIEWDYRNTLEWTQDLSFMTRALKS